MIRLETTSDGFALHLKGHRLLQHSKRRPLVAVGSGQGRYNMSHGHFKISDNLQSRERARDFLIQEQTESRVSVSFPGLIRLTCREKDGRLHVVFDDARPEWNRLWLSISATPDERIYGCGEQFSRLQFQGKKVPLFCQEQGVGRGRNLITLLSNLQSGSGGSWHSTYYPMPTVMSTAGWYCTCDAPAFAEFDFRRPQRHTLQFWQIPQEIVFDVQGSPVDLIRSLTDLLGKQPAMPDWADDGLWLGLQGGSETIRRKVRTARDAGIPVSAVWVQDWVGRRITSFGSQLMWNWKTDPTLYPDMTDLLDELHGDGIKFLGYINPQLAIEEDLYHEASNAGYCVKNAAGQDFMVTMTDFPAALLDLTNPEACRWIKDIIKQNMIGIGLDGWMADYGEYLPPGAVLHSGQDWEQVHNTYPALWAQANREAIQEAGVEDRVTFFVRAGNVETGQHAPAVWAGDQLVNWSRHDGLPSVIPAGLSLGLQGISNFHSDLGGFTTVAWVRRSKELFQRWAELSAFTAIMRTHEGNRPASNWQFDSDGETLNHLARMTQVYRDLKSYRHHANAEYGLDGLPLMRHPWLAYPTDPVLQGLKDQFLLGPDLMVAPVLRPRRKRRRVYLPCDDWVHLWSGKPCGAGWHIEAAPLGLPPVYYRASSSFRSDFQRFVTP